MRGDWHCTKRILFPSTFSSLPTVKHLLPPAQVRGYELDVDEEDGGEGGDQRVQDDQSAEEGCLRGISGDKPQGGQEQHEQVHY